MKKWCISLVCCVVFILGCTQVFEDDIQDKTVVINAPRTYVGSEKFDVISTSSYVFDWDLMTGADEYRLKIDLIDSAQNEVFYSNVWDSLVVGDRAEVDLSEAISLNGRYYRFGVRGQNSAYNSNYAYTTFFRSSSIDLSDKVVELLLPEKGDTIRTLTVRYSWSDFTAGNYDRYLFERLSSSGSVLSTDTLSANTVSKTFIKNDVIEYWRVRAQNNISTTQVQSPIWSFVIDTTSAN